MLGKLLFTNLATSKYYTMTTPKILDFDIINEYESWFQISDEDYVFVNDDEVFVADENENNKRFLDAENAQMWLAIHSAKVNEEHDERINDWFSENAETGEYEFDSRMYNHYSKYEW